ncbi:cyclic di-GMP phosphodiesterase response regulator RpfG [Clostridium homopropionicum DSM 5847]|uniref:Cyclic di-GMP phosphodiesterase response regulator RpfG n=1 Tax=Clostridium homopropionicum DSM 5847 TaxID=1121318 RepID=A0A0L6ZCC5_9CLOT|nr:HD-GYP domain-containing protein [Clostridium homopropionicum]KOA20616.1 cyclic di-GMP phosphodiesterase response regulator RpfG [Clostridium homopropionicum DSM 5847]SFF93049.1 HD-GYP domain, c-di-GMP phosphodiesterase class II (or its inactivated variant) [Clostridium homopropionicum]
MRYVPTSCLRPGMILGKNLYSQDGVVLLAKDVQITKEYIDNIQKLLINGVYIEDSVSENIKIEHVISDELRIKAVKSIKHIYNNPKNITKTLEIVENIAKSVIGEILRNKSVMINMIDIKNYDDFLFSHCVNVAVLSSVIGIALNLEDSKLEKLVASAMLHDIGKVFIPKELLTKEELTEEEEKILKSHPEKGYRYIKTYHNSIAVTSYVGILQHHERFDGKGYPDGKKGEKISLFGRILCLCDIYDKLITERPHRKASLPSEAIEYIMAYNGSVFDPKLVKVFLKKVAPYPLGTIIQLSNGQKSIVVENNEDCSLRPIVRILDNQEIVNLTEDWNYRNVTIVSVNNY